MSTKKVESTVTLRCKIDRIDVFKDAIIKLIRETEKEPGCELFRIFQKNDIPEEFILWEIFKNNEALKVHMEAPYTKECFSLGLFEPVFSIHHTEIK